MIKVEKGILKTFETLKENENMLSLPHLPVKLPIINNTKDETWPGENIVYCLYNTLNFPSLQNLVIFA